MSRVTLKISEYDHYFHKYLNEQWPNLKNLSGGLNLSRGLNMVGSTLVDLNRDLNSLNSISSYIFHLAKKETIEIPECKFTE